MSVKELLRQVAALPPPERERFQQLLRAMEKNEGVSANANQRTWPDFGERLHCIYGNKVTPDSQRIIDEGRGER